MSAPFDIIALLYPKPGKSDRVEELLKAVAASAKVNEPGTLRYQVHREVNGDAPAIVMLETYKDKASLQAHGSTDKFKELGRTFKKEDLLGKPMQILFTKEVGGYASKL